MDTDPNGSPVLTTNQIIANVLRIGLEKLGDVVVDMADADAQNQQNTIGHVDRPVCLGDDNKVFDGGEIQTNWVVTALTQLFTNK
jgi:hypothetical protein